MKLILFIRVKTRSNCDKKDQGSPCNPLSDRTNISISLYPNIRGDPLPKPFCIPTTTRKKNFTKEAPTNYQSLDASPEIQCYYRCCFLLILYFTGFLMNSLKSFFEHFEFTIVFITFLRSFRSRKVSHLVALRSIYERNIHTCVRNEFRFVVFFIFLLFFVTQKSKYNSIFTSVQKNSLKRANGFLKVWKFSVLAVEDQKKIEEKLFSPPK